MEIDRPYRDGLADPGFAGDGEGMDRGVEGTLHLVPEGALLEEQETERLSESGHYHCPKDSLTRRRRPKGLYGKEFEDSITRMEKFLPALLPISWTTACGFRNARSMISRLWIWEISATARWSSIPVRWKGKREAGSVFPGKSGHPHIDESVEEAVAGLWQFGIRTVPPAMNI